MEETVYTGPASLCEEASRPYSITVYKIASLEDKQDEGKAGKKKKKKAKHFCLTFGIRTSASGKESCPGDL